ASKRLRQLLFADNDCPIVEELLSRPIGKSVTEVQPERLVYYEHISKNYPEMMLEETIGTVGTKKRDTRLTFENFDLEFSSVNETRSDGQAEFMVKKEP